jgi:hypothetical protein
MTKPTIHLNGSYPGNLLEDLQTIQSAVRNAVEAVMEHGSPNARDYYPQGPSAHAAAVAEHQGRIERLESVRKEFEELADHVMAAIAEREARRK